MSLEQIWQGFVGTLLDQVSDDDVFIHYTSAEAAEKIIRNKEIWLRSLDVMNDLREVEFGLNIVIEVLSEIDEFYKLLHLNKNDFLPRLESQKRQMKRDAFAFCISRSKKYSIESQQGKLSMWRAYAQNNGVAIVCNPLKFRNNSLISKDITYVDKNDAQKFVKETIVRLIDIVQRNRSFGFLIEDNKEKILEFFYMVLIILMCTIKNKIFEEENERRILFFKVKDFVSPIIKTNYEVIRGVPQMVGKLKLVDLISMDGSCFDINDLVSHVIVGPSDYQSNIADVFRELLPGSSANGHERVRIADIPLRLNA